MYTYYNVEYTNKFNWSRNTKAINPFSAGTAFMLMQTGWIQARRRVTRRLAWDPTCLPLSLSLPIKNKQNLLVLKSRRQYNIFLENYPAFKGLIRSKLFDTHTIFVTNFKWLWSTLKIAEDKTISMWHFINRIYVVILCLASVIKSVTFNKCIAVFLERHCMGTALWHASNIPICLHVIVYKSGIFQIQAEVYHSHLKHQRKIQGLLSEG